MKITAELKEITAEMTPQELADALNHNFKELKETSENRDQAMLNSIKRVETKLDGLGSKVLNVENDVKKILNHLSGKKLLTEND